jgi:hypothetical protein
VFLRIVDHTAAAVPDRARLLGVRLAPRRTPAAVSSRLFR